MRMKCWLLVIVLAAMTWACSDDDTTVTDNPPEPEVPEEPKERKLLFTVAENAIVAIQNVWVVLSDKDGTVLNAAQLRNGSDFTFEASEDFEDDDITLTIVSNYNSDDGRTYTEINTYTRLPFGQYGMASTVPFVDPPVKGEVVVNLDAGEGPVPYVRPSGPALGSWGYEPIQGRQDVIYCDLKTDKSGVLLTKITAPFTYLYTDIAIDKTYTFSIEEFHPAEAKDIKVPDSDYSTFELVGKNDYGNFSYFSYREDAQGDVGEYISVPSLPDFFTSYEVDISAQTGRVFENYKYKGGKIPDAMKHLDGTFEYTGTGSTVSWKTSGTLDAIQLRVFGFAQNGGGYWTVFGPPGSQHIVLPAIPANVSLASSDALERSFDMNVTRYGRLETQISEYPEHTGYTAVVLKPQLVPGTSFEFTEFLRRNVTLK
jgi:hypothetical protein